MTAAAQRGYSRPVFLGGLLVLVALVWWLVDPVQTPEQAERAGEARVPDYYMRDFTLTVTSPLGEPEKRIQAAYMAHYPLEASTELVSPQVEFSRAGGLQWRVEAGKGIINDDNTVVLRDEVTVLRAAQADQPAATAHTQEFYVDLNKNIGETYEPITLVSPTARVEANGMRVFVEEERMVLFAGVRARYAP